MNTKELMRAKLDELTFKRWSRLYEQTERLNLVRKSHSLEGIKLARESDRIYKQWDKFWKHSKDQPK